MCNGFRKSIELAEKCEVSGKRIFAANFSLKANGIGEMYNRFGMFCQQYYGSASGDDLPHDDAERNILVSILRGMKYGSKNARLQFPRILKLPFLIRMQSSDEFNREVSSQFRSRTHICSHILLHTPPDGSGARMDVYHLDTTNSVTIRICVAMLSRWFSGSFSENVSIGHAVSIPIGLFAVSRDTN